MVKNREFIAKRISVPLKLYDAAMKAIEKGQFPGLRNFSQIVEKALDELLSRANKENNASRPTEDRCP